MKKIFTILSVAAVSLVSAQNLIPNSGFEIWADGKPSEWFIPNGVTMVQSTTAKSGQYSAGMPSPSTGNRTTSPTVDTPVTKGTTYVFQGWYLDNTPKARFRYWNQFRNSADTGTNEMQMSDYSVDSPEWQFFKAEAQPNTASSAGNTTGQDATVARPGLRLYPENNQGDGVIYFDDIAFYVKGTMNVSDIKAFDKAVQFNTVVNNEITFKLPARATVNVYSAEGRLMSSDRVDNGGSVNTSKLTKGTYIVTVDNGIDKISRKVIKN